MMTWKNYSSRNMFKTNPYLTAVVSPGEGIPFWDSTCMMARPLWPRRKKKELLLELLAPQKWTFLGFWGRQYKDDQLMFFCSEKSIMQLFLWRPISVSVVWLMGRNGLCLKSFTNKVTSLDLVSCWNPPGGTGCSWCTQGHWGELRMLSMLKSRLFLGNDNNWFSIVTAVVKWA